MKALFAWIIIIVFGLLAHLFLPWWTIAIVCFIAGFTFIDKTKYGILVGFTGVFILWGVSALTKSYNNDFILVERMANLLQLHNKWLLLLATAVMGGIIGLLSTLSGYFLQTINEKPKRRSSRY